MGPRSGPTFRATYSWPCRSARQCVACHLNIDQMNELGGDYQACTTMINNDIQNLDYNLVHSYVRHNHAPAWPTPRQLARAVGRFSGTVIQDLRKCRDDWGIAFHMIWYICNVLLCPLR